MLHLSSFRDRLFLFNMHTGTTQSGTESDIWCFVPSKMILKNLIDIEIDIILERLFRLVIRFNILFEICILDLLISNHTIYFHILLRFFYHYVKLGTTCTKDTLYVCNYRSWRSYFRTAFHSGKKKIWEIACLSSIRSFRFLVGINTNIVRLGQKHHERWCWDNLTCCSSDYLFLFNDVVILEITARYFVA